ncbi:MAG TPA: hypothetical protein VFZ67_03735 [Nitrososphaera sp.]
MTGYGQTVIERAEKLGYVKREKRKPPRGKGFHPVYNLLTRKRLALLEKLKEAEETLPTTTTTTTTTIVPITPQPGMIHTIMLEE